jgi:transcriptional regulator with XRE-family HTH domain
VARRPAVAQRPNSLVVALGLAIRELRVEREWSQEELSLRSGVHRNYIGGVERAERRPSVETVGKLADALGVEPSQVFRRAERLRN